MDFLGAPANEKFFTYLLGGRPGWAPVAEYRILPPREKREGDRKLYVHQDGFYNEGYTGLTCWILVWDVFRRTGGLAVAEGMHNGPYFHDLEQLPRFPIPAGAIPETSWRTTGLPGRGYPDF